MGDLDLNGLDYSVLADHSTFLVNQIAEHEKEQQEIFDEIAEHNAKKDAALFQASEASVAQKELLENQLAQLKIQNQLLEDNYHKLEDMYNNQKESYNNARKDLKSSRKFNAWMMVIAIIAMLAAIAGPIVTVLVSR